MEKTLSEQLADNLAYYVNDTTKRCTNGEHCYYSGETAKKDSEGCFVGRLLTPEDRLKADKELASGISGVEALCGRALELGITIPKIISENKTLVRQFQSLHDNDENWIETGLSINGKSKLKYLITQYILEEKYFEKYLVDTE